jgi:hypothetical protein
MASFARREVVDTLFHDLIKEFFLGELAMQQLKKGTMDECDYFDHFQPILNELI